MHILRSPTARSALVAAIGLLGLANVAESAWHHNSWLYRKLITVNGGLVTAAQSNFPVLVSLTADADLAADARNDGADILFTSADGVSQLDHEIESFDGATGALVAWVRVPSLASGANTVLYMYYGNAVAPSQENPAGVWDPTYDNVWHLGASLQDSTSSANNGTDNGGSTVVAGAVGSGRSFDGVNDYISTATAMTNQYANLTVESWVRTSAAAGVPIVSWEGPNPTGPGNAIWDAGIYVGTDADLRFYTWGTGIGRFATAVGTYSNNTWYHVVGVSDASAGQTRIYVNGVLAATTAYILTDGGTHYWRIGSYKNQLHTAGADGYFNGQVDEVRVGTKVPSASWIQTTYNNQANQGVGPGKFLLGLAPEETLSGSPCTTTALDAVQRGTVTLANGSSTVTVSSPALTAVDPTQAFLVFGVEESTSSPGDGQISGQIVAGGSQLSFERVGTTGNVTIHWQVAEFSRGVSVQRGSVNIDGLVSANAALSAVDLGKSFPLISYRVSGTVWDLDDFVRAELTGTTTLTVSRSPGATSTTGAVVEWQVVEYACASVQSGNVTFAYNETAKPAAPTAVDTNKAWLVYSYDTPRGTTSDVGQKLVRGRVTGASSLSFDRDNAYATPGEDANLSWYLVEFTDGTLVQQGSESFSAASNDTAKNVALSPVEPARSFAAGGTMARGGKSPYSADDNPGVAWFASELTSSTNLQLRRQPGNLADADVGWFVVYFAGGGQRYRKPIVIDNAVLGASCAGDVTDFPVLVRIASDNDLRTVANGGKVESANGYDLVFKSDTLDVLDFEIERYVPTTGELVAWVRVPTLALAADTTINLDYGDPTVTTSLANPAGVWDGNHAGVWHLVESPAEGVPGHFDSTTPGQTGTPLGFADGGGGSTSAAGMAAGADFFANELVGSTNRVEIPSDPSLYPTGDLTVEGWFTTSDPSSADHVLYMWDGPSFSYQMWVAGATPVIRFQWRNSTGTAPTAVGTTAITADTWHHVVGVRRGTQLEVYLDGNLEATVGGATGVINPPSDPFVIGAVYNNGGGLGGSVDEVRVSDNARSQCWIETEYNNYHPGSTSVTPGGEIPTAVTLLSFDAAPLAGAAELTWETGTEIDNLGFHLYRGASATGGFERITESLVPGLGSTPRGARYRYRDGGLQNGETYYYVLEDVETTGRRERHGPVAVTPRADAPVETTPDSLPSPKSAMTFGEPSRNSLRVVRRGADRVLLSLHTEGFHAYPEPDGTLRFEVPGFVDTGGALPVRRAWVDAVAGREARVVSVRERGRERIGLRLSGEGELEVVASRDGTVRLRRGRRSSSTPEATASVVDVLRDGASKRALVELAPLRFGSDGLLLARDLDVVLSFREPDRKALAASRREWSLHRRGVLARLATVAPGLYAVRFEDVFPRRRRSVPAHALRLSRLGESVPFHVEPDAEQFAPGATLYFVSPGADANPYGNEAVFELEAGEGTRMEVRSAPPAGPVLGHHRYRLELEEDRLYPSALVDAPDLWLWDSLLSGVAKRYPFAVTGLAEAPEPARLEVRLQGGSDFTGVVDHHVRVRVNDALVGEAFWDGKEPKRLALDVPEGLLRSGENVLELDNAGDTAADYSLVYLDGFALEVARENELEDGALRGSFDASGEVALAGARYVVDVTSGDPAWILGSSSSEGVSFAVTEGHHYLALAPSAVLAPEVRPAARDRWRSTRRRADYLAIGPRAFLDAAAPLFEQRRSQGLRVVSVPIEEVFDEFGFGERRPEAIRELLAHAVRNWRGPAPRYALLLGDASYDYKDHLGTGVQNQVPALIVRTSFVWTASDPALAAVGDDDLLPALAIGRLPAASVEEVRRMVAKILAYENGGGSIAGPSVVVTDDPDDGGDFDADGDAVAALLGWDRTTRIALGRLDTATARTAVVAAFDVGASTYSYIGHGGIHLWASENLLDTSSVEALAPQPQQPILLTLNCLNGYFHFPFFDSLAESLLKAEAKGAVAAFSPTGLSLNEPAHALHLAVLEELSSGRHRTLGDAILAAERRFATETTFPELLAIYHLLGDPALALR